MNMSKDQIDNESASKLNEIMIGKKFQFWWLFGFVQLMKFLYSKSFYIIWLDEAIYENEIWNIMFLCSSTIILSVCSKHKKKNIIQNAKCANVS